MIFRPHLQDFKLIGFYLGKIIIGLAFTMIIPIIIGIIAKEINPTLDFLITLLISLLIGICLTKLSKTDQDLNWMQGMIVVSLSWLVACVLGAIPLSLSGHFKSFLDACFEALSALTTTGLVLVQDLDHMSYSHNLWRHILNFIGGQGMIIIALSFFIKGTSGALKMYVGEGREEKILPNVINTSRFIWIISLVYLCLGTLALAIAGIVEGIRPLSSFFHGACIFMAGFDTGGFAPNSQNVLYYHSLIYEVVIIIIMIIGAFNFNFHFQIWLGNRKEIWKNIESRIFFISVVLIFLFVAAGLSKLGIYQGILPFFRKGFFHLISGHTTTGYMTVYAKQFILEWGNLALLGLICAMGFGASSCSTAGGIKMLRVGIIAKALAQDIKRIMLPEKAIVIQKFHHIKEVFLDDKIARSALMIAIAYLVLYSLGTIVALWCGYPFLDSLFESVSSAANVGLSCGITDAGMPNILKITYMFQMWAGRLEFMSIFALIGFAIAAVKGR